MPIYCYECTKCETFFEKFHGMNEKLTRCPSCETEDSLKKVPSLARIKVQDNVGKVTRESIEENREELNNTKQSLKEKK